MVYLDTSLWVGMTKTKACIVQWKVRQGPDLEGLIYHANELELYLEGTGGHEAGM